MSRFGNQTVLITGGAHGIGLATARQFLDQGARVAIWALNPESVEHARQTLGHEVFGLAVDVGQREAVDDACQRVSQHLGPVEILVNNAGYTLTTPFLSERPEYWERVMATNLWGPIYTCRALLPTMVERGRGSVVNVVSDAGRVGMAGEAVYAAGKAGVVALAKSLAQEMARHHIRINCVSPGPTRTRILEENSQGAESLIEKMVKRIPLREIAEPEDVASAIVFLAGPESRHITGQTLSVSGGLTMV
jgi:2-hydroxycyclohexanecarboxyl-CoA dehydrogenase